MYSANLEKTRKISDHSQRSMHWNCALERRFPSPEERVRPSFPARSETGLISVSPCPSALAGNPLTVWKCHLELTVLTAATALWRHRGHWETLLKDTFAFLAQLSVLLSSKLKSLPEMQTTVSLSTKKMLCMCMHQADWSHPTEDLQGRGAAWGKSSVDLIPLGTTEHRGPSWEGGGELLITSSFLEVFRALLKAMCIWKYFVYKGTTETLG